MKPRKGNRKPNEDDKRREESEQRRQEEGSGAEEQRRLHEVKQGGRKSLLKPGSKKLSASRSPLSAIAENKPAPQPKPVTKSVPKHVEQTITMAKLPLYEGARNAQGAKYAALSEHFKSLSAGLPTAFKPVKVTDEELLADQLAEELELDALDEEEETEGEAKEVITPKKNQPDALQNVMRALDKVKYRLLQDYKVGGNQRHQLQRRQQVLSALKPRIFSSNPHKIVPRDVISFRQSKLLTDKEQIASSFWTRLETTDLNM